MTNLLDLCMKASNGDKRLASCSATLAEIAELVDCEIETTPEDQLRAIRANLEQVLQSMPDELSDSLVQRETFTDEQVHYPERFSSCAQSNRPDIARRWICFDNIWNR